MGMFDYFYCEYDIDAPEGLAFNMGFNIEKKQIERENDRPDTVGD